MPKNINTFPFKVFITGDNKMPEFDIFEFLSYGHGVASTTDLQAFEVGGTC